MDHNQNRKWMYVDELIGTQIVSSLRAGHDQFMVRSRDLIGAGFTVADILERLGPGWSEREGVEDGEVILHRNISSEQAIGQIHQRVGLRTPLSGKPI